MIALSIIDKGIRATLIAWRCSVKAGMSRKGGMSAGYRRRIESLRRARKALADQLERS